MRFSEKFSRMLSRYGLPEGLFARLAAAYLAVSGTSAIFARRGSSDPVSAWRDYVAAGRLWPRVFWTALVFLWISAVFRVFGERFRRLDFALLGGAAVFFALSAVWCSGSVYFGIAAGAVAAVLAVYAASKAENALLKPSGKGAAAVVFLLAGGVFAFTAVTTVFNHKNFGTSCFDMGIFVQTFNSLKENLNAVITCERDGLMSHFRVHTSYIFYLFLPVYALFPRPETLLVAQAFFAMGGILPLYLIAKKRSFGGVLTVSACSLYIFCTGLILPCYYSFHENAFLPTLLMWLLWAAEAENMPVFAVFSALVCTVKEDAPLYVICIGIWYFLEKRGKKRWIGAIAALLAAGYFAAAMRWLNLHGDGEYMTATRFGILMANGGGIGEIISNAISDPAYLVSLMLRSETLGFAAETLLPLMLLPFITAKPQRLILTAPYLIMNLIIGAGYEYAAQTGFQYILGPVCLLIYLALINADDLPKKVRNCALIAAAVLSTVTGVAAASKKLSVVKEHIVREEFYDSAEECLRSIPKEGAVLANTFFVPHIADRAEIYELGDGRLIRDESGRISDVSELERYDYVVLSRLDPLTEELAPVLEARGMRVWAESEGFVVVYGWE